MTKLFYASLFVKDHIFSDEPRFKVHAMYVVGPESLDSKLICVCVCMEALVIVFMVPSLT